MSAPTPAQVPAKSRNDLILEYYPMVRRVAYRMARRLPHCVDAEDLVHIGVLGLIDAVDRYEPHRARSFAAYARIRVQGAMVDEMRKNDWVPRSVRNRAARLERTRRELREQLGRVPTNEEMADSLGIDVDRLDTLSRTADVRVLVSTEEGSDDEGTVGESLANPEIELDELIARRHMGEKIRGILDALPERERLIVDLYYYRDLNFKEIAAILGVTESRVSQLHSRMKRRIQERLETLVARGHQGSPCAPRAGGTPAGRVRGRGSGGWCEPRQKENAHQQPPARRTPAPRR